MLLKVDRTIKISNEGQIAIKIRNSKTKWRNNGCKPRNKNKKDAISIYFDAIILMVPYNTLTIGATIYIVGLIITDRTLNRAKSFYF